MLKYDEFYGRMKEEFKNNEYRSINRLLGFQYSCQINEKNYATTNVTYTKYKKYNNTEFNKIDSFAHEPNIRNRRNISTRINHYID